MIEYKGCIEKIWLKPYRFVGSTRATLQFDLSNASSYTFKIKISSVCVCIGKKDACTNDLFQSVVFKSDAIGCGSICIGLLDSIG